MKIIPAVFFQKKLNGAEASVKTPERLELFESELREVVGGALRAAGAAGAVGAVTRLDGGCGCPTTYSGSQGWLDLASADD